MPKLPVIHVVAAVITSGRSVFVCRRRSHLSEGGRWEFPGGKVEPGESPTQALERELREELNVAVVAGKTLTLTDTPQANRVIRLECISTEFLGSGPKSSTDHDAMRWQPIQALDALDWAPADLPTVRHLMSFDDERARSSVRKSNL